MAGFLAALCMLGIVFGVGAWPRSSSRNMAGVRIGLVGLIALCVYGLLSLCGFGS